MGALDLRASERLEWLSGAHGRPGLNAPVPCSDSRDGAFRSATKKPGEAGLYELD